MIQAFWMVRDDAVQHRDRMSVGSEIMTSMRLRASGLETRQRSTLNPKPSKSAGKLVVETLRAQGYKVAGTVFCQEAGVGGGEVLVEEASAFQHGSSQVRGPRGMPLITGGLHQEWTLYMHTHTHAAFSQS